MTYAIRHRTTYTYESRVTYARCVLRLTPRSTSTQTVLDTSLVITPEPVRSLERVGPFGELTTTVVIEAPHRSLIIESTAHVDVHPPPGRLDFGEPWEAVRARGLEAAELEPHGPADYIYPAVRTPLTAEITEYARLSFGARRGIVEAATELMGRIYADFAFDPRATDVSTPPIDAFRARRGVCQDFAHIMICGVRGLGLPVRYVSGYLRTLPPPGQPRLEGADATHAWVEVWCGEETGWIGFDPTNDIIVQDDHIVLATGRDYADVAPIDGIILSPGKQTLSVEVDVAPVYDNSILRPSFGSRPGATITAGS